MSFSEAVRSVYGNYAKFDGRAPRSEYWWYQLFNVIVAFGIFAVAIAAAVPTRSTAAFGVVFLGAAVFGLVSFVPSLAVTVRRLHDTDHSGWWLLILLVPYVGGIIVFVFMLLSGSPGMNRFGPPPGYGPGEQFAEYRGRSHAEVEQRFAWDAHTAAGAGFHPVWQEWRERDGESVLRVSYARPWAHQPWVNQQWPTPPGGYPQSGGGLG
jgi:uncharacterized membrane protein YhaH (DUF805 family)